MNSARSIWPWLAIAVVVAVLLLGLRNLFSARFARGDLFPKYSTLRSDPLGAMVLYEGLGGAGIDTARNFRDLEHATPPEGTLYACGVDWSDFADDDVTWWKLLLERMERGGRVVVTFAATSPPDERLDELLKSFRTKRKPDEKDEKKEDEKKDGDNAPDEETKSETAKPELILTRLGLKQHWLGAPKGADLTAKRADTAVDLPDSLPWHTALSFEPSSDPAWRTIYSVGVHPVVLERAIGKGTLVLVGDAFLLSNEAMLRARAPRLLTWLQGGARRAVFDESHLGVTEDLRLSSLARRYGLTHAALVLVFVALLFVWKSATSLVPSAEVVRVSGSEAGEFAGRESAAGFVSLLRRTLAPGQLFAACVAEYRRSNAWRRASEPARKSLEALASPEATRDPVDATRRAHELLARKL